MATKYVSQTSTNGYAVGNDANDGSTKLLAKLTLESAITAASPGDTIVINDGTYTAATYFDVAKALTINAENSRQVVLKRTGAVGQVIRVGVAGGTINLGALVIDAEADASASCVGINGTTARTVALNGTLLRNPGAGRFAVESINSNQVLTLRVTDVDATTTTTSGGIYALLGAAAIIDINGFTVDNTAGTGVLSNSRCPVYLNASASAMMHIRRVTGTWKTAAAAVSSSFIRSSGLRGLIERNTGMRITGGDTSGCLIRCENTSGVQSDGIVIAHNQGGNETTGGFLILVGADGSGANDNKTNRAVIYGNDMYGTDSAALMHGIMIGSSLGGVMCGNTVRNAAIPFLSKLTAEAVYMVDNDIIGPYTSTSGCLRGKGATNLQVVGNRVRLAAGKTNPAIVFDRDPTIPTLSTGCSAVRNTLYSPVEVPVAVTVGGTTDASSATFALNNYRSASYAAGAFVYGANSYSTVTTWAAAQEGTARDVIPVSSDPRFWQDAYRPMKDAALATGAGHLLGVF